MAKQQVRKIKKKLLKIRLVQNVAHLQSFSLNFAKIHSRFLCTILYFLLPLCLKLGIDVLRFMLETGEKIFCSENG